MAAGFLLIALAVGVLLVLATRPFADWRDDNGCDMDDSDEAAK